MATRSVEMNAPDKRPGHEGQFRVQYVDIETREVTIRHKRTRPADYIFTDVVAGRVLIPANGELIVVEISEAGYKELQRRSKDKKDVIELFNGPPPEEQEEQEEQVQRKRIAAPAASVPSIKEEPPAPQPTAAEREPRVIRRRRPDKE
jgi:hypothetical protein